MTDLVLLLPLCIDSISNSANITDIGTITTTVANSFDLAQVPPLSPPSGRAVVPLRVTYNPFFPNPVVIQQPELYNANLISSGLASADPSLDSRCTHCIRCIKNSCRFCCVFSRVATCVGVTLGVTV